MLEWAWTPAFAEATSEEACGGDMLQWPGLPRAFPLLFLLQGGAHGALGGGLLAAGRAVARLAFVAAASPVALVALIPARLAAGLFSFALPFPAPEISVSMLWHPRMDGDEAHRWLREQMRDICGGERREEPCQA